MFLDRCAGKSGSLSWIVVVAVVLVMTGTMMRVKALARMAVKIEKRYGRPMDTEWARDRDDGKLYVVRAQPETMASHEKVGVIEEFKMLEKGKEVVAEGRASDKRIGNCEDLVAKYRENLVGKTCKQDEEPLEEYLETGKGPDPFRSKTKERMGRMVLMHRNKPEDIKDDQCGDTIAMVGLNDTTATTTSDTLRAVDSPVVLAKMDFLEPVIKVSCEPTSQKDADKLGEALNKLAAEEKYWAVLLRGLRVGLDCAAESLHLLLPYETHPGDPPMMILGEAFMRRGQMKGFAPAKGDVQAEALLRS